MIEQQAKAVREIHVQTAVTCSVMSKTCYRHVYKAVVGKCCGTYILKTLQMNRSQIFLCCGWYHEKICHSSLKKISFEFASHLVSIGLQFSCWPHIPITSRIQKTLQVPVHTPVQEELIKSREGSADQGF